MMPSTPPRMLVVSGDYDFCDTLTNALSEQGFEVDFAYDSQTAAEAVRERHYKTVVLDHWTPYLNAVPLARTLKRRQPDAVMLTVCSPVQAGWAQTELGNVSDRVMEKSGDLDDLLCAVRDVAGQWESNIQEESGVAP